jgi:hypothetical protein
LIVENNLRGIMKPWIGRISAFFRATSLIIFGVCVFVSGCKFPPSWSAEARSPDGKMIATAKTFENSGFGTGGGGTVVYLNWTTGSQLPMEILSFSDGPAGPGGMNVGMNWLTPTHLEITYKGHRTLDFQAVKCAGIDISVRALSSVETNTVQ